MVKVGNLVCFLGEYRCACGLSQSMLAELAHCSRNAICDLERGRYNPTLYLSLRIVDALNRTCRLDRYILVQDLWVMVPKSESDFDIFEGGGKE